MDVSRLRECQPFCARLPASSLPSFSSAGMRYASFIFTGEYLSGILLSRKKVCPWNYGRSRWHIRKLIRLDFFPHWFLAGLLFERLLAPDKHKAV